MKGENDRKREKETLSNFQGAYRDFCRQSMVIVFLKVTHRLIARKKIVLPATTIVGQQER